MVRLLIRRYLNENSRQLWMSTGVCFGIMLLMALLFNSNYEYGWGAVIWMMFFFIGSISVGVSASLTFSSMSSKPGRIVAMMLPASKAEKFTSLMLIYNVFGPIAILLSALAADTLSSLLHMHAPYFFDAFKIVIDVFPQIDFEDFREHWGEIIEASSLLLLGFASLFLCNQAIYTLGSAWWPKKSFIKTFCALYALQMLLGIVMSARIFNLNWFFRWIADLNFEDISWHFIAWGSLIVWYGIIFAIFWAAWRRYKNTQLVQKFMMN